MRLSGGRPLPARETGRAAVVLPTPIMDNVWFRREQLFNCLDRRGYVSWRKRRICMTDYGKISF